MRPTEVTAEQIIAAGESLIAEGRKVTGSGLRRITGAGNPARLAQVWEAHQAKSGKAGKAKKLPAATTAEVAKATSEITTRVGRLAVDLHEQAEKAARLRVEVLEGELAKERDRSSRLARDLADAKRGVIDVAKLQGRIDALTEQNALLLARLESGGKAKPRRK